MLGSGQSDQSGYAYIGVRLVKCVLICETSDVSGVYFALHFESQMTISSCTYCLQVSCGER